MVSLLLIAITLKLKNATIIIIMSLFSPTRFITNNLFLHVKSYNKLLLHSLTYCPFPCIDKGFEKAYEEHWNISFNGRKDKNRMAMTTFFAKSEGPLSKLLSGPADGTHAGGLESLQGILTWLMNKSFTRGRTTLLQPSSKATLVPSAGLFNIFWKWTLIL